MGCARLLLMEQMRVEDGLRTLWTLHPVGCWHGLLNLNLALWLLLLLLLWLLLYLLRLHQHLLLHGHVHLHGWRRLLHVEDK